MNEHEKRIAQLERDNADLWAHIHAMTAMFAALIKTHPNYAAMQLEMTSALEVVLGGNRAESLAPAQSEMARNIVEKLQTLGPSKHL